MKFLLILVFLIPVYLFSEDWQVFTSTSNVVGLMYSNNKVWTGSSGGVLSIDLTTNKKTKITSLEGLLVTRVNACNIDKNGLLYFGSEDSGLSVYDPQNNIWYYFTTFEGLPSNEILCIGTDENNIWVGTDKGVAQFKDSKHIRNFDETNGLKNSTISSVFYDSNSGKIYFGTYGVISCYQDGEWSHYDYSNSNLPEKPIVSIATSQDSSLWALPVSMYPYIYKFDGEGNTWQESREGLPDSLTVYFIKRIDDILYLGSDKGLFKWEKPEWIEIEKDLPDKKIKDLLFVNGKIWVGTEDKGVFQKTSTGWVSQQPSEMKNNVITSVFLDSRKRIWVAGGMKPGTRQTGDWGVSILIGNEWKHLSKESGELIDNCVMGIDEDENGYIWLPLYSRYLSVLDQDLKADDYWKNFKWSEDPVWKTKEWTLTGVQRGTSREMFVSSYGWRTERGGVFKWDMNSKTWSQLGETDNTKMTVYKRSPENHHFASIYNYYFRVFDGNEWKIYNNNDGIPSTDIADFAFEGNIAWIATGSGLCKFINGDITVYNKSSVAELEIDNFSAVCVDWKGNKWIGSKFGGIIEYSSDGKWTNLQIGNAASSPYVYQIIADKENERMIFATACGLWFYTLPPDLPRQLTQVDCYPNPLYYKSSNKSIFFDKLNQNAKLYIWTISGRKVNTETRFVETDHRTYALEWLVPESISSGIYIYIIEQENTRVKGKLAIIRK
ncbi:MAG: T9SS type A sorting domain-containing protein [Candidatus Coatesbacteria bacterium]|nr:T9SS type A sorting domain-containing protein [Candidatus Coatesbacteria bacterium]